MVKLRIMENIYKEINECIYFILYIKNIYIVDCGLKGER